MLVRRKNLELLNHGSVRKTENITFMNHDTVVLGDEQVVTGVKP
jgi:hypothetical protein